MTRREARADDVGREPVGQQTAQAVAGEVQQLRAQLFRRNVELLRVEAGVREREDFA
jgi:hypothetical protein